MSRYNLLVILGATATGKTKLAVQLAHKLNGEIISADSRQVFKGMNIGTGKDLNEYFVGEKAIPHHLIDILEAGDKYNVDQFKTDFYSAFSAVTAKSKLPILCGGTGMYIHSVLMHQPFTAVPINLLLREELLPLDVELLKLRFLDFKESRLKHTDLYSKKRLVRAIEIATFLRNDKLPEIDRPKINPIVFGLKSEMLQTRANIQKRLEKRLSDGLIEEVAQLLASGISFETLVFYGLEYKFVAQYLCGAFNLEELQTKLYIAICQYAKRQNTFFRKMAKDGIQINWLDAALPTNKLQENAINEFYHTFIINQSID